MTDYIAGVDNLVVVLTGQAEQASVSQFAKSVKCTELEMRGKAQRIARSAICSAIQLCHNDTMTAPEFKERGQGAWVPPGMGKGILAH